MIRRNVAFWTFAWLFFYTIHTFGAADWQTAVIPSIASVVRLEMQQGEESGSCSGALLNETSGFVVTMAHCTGTDPRGLSMTANGRHAEFIKANSIIDLAVIRFVPKKERAIALAKDTPLAGAEIALLGFAYGSRLLYMQFGHVSLPLEADGRLMLDVTGIHGDSGGPAINAAGELVGMTSAIKTSGGSLIVMVPVEAVRDFVEPYLPKK